ncbi:MAG TPA: hypothetical protein VK041_04610 [Opitutales bacterium]|nr:hypothetical protein [Opitutales bacterium]
MARETHDGVDKNKIYQGKAMENVAISGRAIAGGIRFLVQFKVFLLVSFRNPFFMGTL